MRFIDCEKWTCLEGGGVWEVAAPWAWTDLDMLRDGLGTNFYGRMHQYTVALNWYWNPQTRWGLDWIYAKPISGTGGADENCFESQHARMSGSDSASEDETNLLRNTHYPAKPAYKPGFLWNSLTILPISRVRETFPTNPFVLQRSKPTCQMKKRSPRQDAAKEREWTVNRCLPSHNPKNRILREGTRLAYLIALSLSGMLLLYGDVKGCRKPLDPPRTGS
jgi:hypothetical protein